MEEQPKQSSGEFILLLGPYIEKNTQRRNVVNPALQRLTSPLGNQNLAVSKTSNSASTEYHRVEMERVTL